MGEKKRLVLGTPKLPVVVRAKGTLDERGNDRKETFAVGIDYEKFRRGNTVEIETMIRGP